MVTPLDPEPHFGEGEEPHFCLQDVSLKFTIQVRAKKEVTQGGRTPKMVFANNQEGGLAMSHYRYLSKFRLKNGKNYA